MFANITLVCACTVPVASGGRVASTVHTYQANM